MEETSVLELATEEDLLYLLRRSAQEVLDGKRERVRLILNDFGDDLLYSEPQIIFTAKGIQRVNRARRQGALKALQAELGMEKIVYREFRSGPLLGILGLSEHQQVVSKKMFATAHPNVFFVRVTSWWRGRNRANRTVWYLVRTDTSVLSRLWRRITGWQPFTKG